MLRACGYGQSTAVHLDQHFVPSGWLEKEFPKHVELIEMIEGYARDLPAEYPSSSNDWLYEAW